MELEGLLKRGMIYRKSELEAVIDLDKGDLQKLVDNGSLDKIANDLYYYPKLSVFGNVPPNANDLLSKYLNYEPFLITSLNHYNNLGVGTTQLYNVTLVYNKRLSGKRKLGKKVYHFKKKKDFPTKLSLEYLLVDLINNLQILEEDQDQILNRVRLKITKMASQSFDIVLNKYGTSRTKRLLKKCK